MISAAQLVAIVNKPENDNMRSFIAGLTLFGEKVGLDLPHRLAQYVPQAAHESAAFRYDRELWDGKGAQARYDTRTDLGNTPEVDGDGYRNRGRGPFQLTGGYNIRKFTGWAKDLDPNAPNFFANPDLINTDPWEGLSAIWYWDVGNPEGKSLNRYADQGDNEMVTRRINGGLNGYADRLRLYDRTALVLLGLPPTAVSGFQADQGLAVDGISGPKTRAAMHSALKAMSSLAPTAPVEVPQITDPRALIAEMRDNLDRLEAAL